LSLAVGSRGGKVKKAAIIGLLALLALTTIVFAAPALSTSSKQEVTVQQLARQVRALRAQVVAADKRARNARLSADGAHRLINETNQRLVGVATVATKLDNCLSRSLAVTRYGGFVDTDAAAVFTDYDPDVLGYVPNIVSGSFGLPAALDVTNPGTSVSYYLAIVEPSCAGGFRIAQRQEAVGR
jgi:hypothetical protein